MSFKLIDLVIDNDVIEFESASDLLGHLLDDEHIILSCYLVQVWAGDNLIESIRADKWIDIQE